MTRFRAPEPQVTTALLGSLAEAAVRNTLALGARIADAIERSDNVRHGLASAADEPGAALSSEMVELALSNAGNAPPIELGNKLAFQILTTRPNSSVARLLTGVAERAFRRAGPALGPLLEQGDLVSLLRWKLWTLPADYFSPNRILKHPGLAAYLSVIARRIVIDECRAMDNCARTGIEPESVESAVDPRAALDSVLDELDLLRRFASELSDWQAPLVQVLAGQLDREQALVAINHKREAAGLQDWSADAMRTAIHRARKRLRELMMRSSTLQAKEAPRPPSI